MGCGHSDTTNSAPIKVYHPQPIVHNQPLLQPQLGNEQRVNIDVSSQKKSILKVSQREKEYLDESEKKETVSDLHHSQDLVILPQATTSYQLLSLLIAEIQSHSIYSALLDAEYLAKCIQQLSVNYLDINQRESTVTLIIDYATSSLNLLPNQEAFKFVQQFSKKLYHLSRQAKQANKNELKLLDYIGRQGKCFVDLKFDLSLKELQEVMGQVRKLLRYSQQSIYYVLLYLQISAFRLQNSLVPIIQIELKLTQCLKLLSSSPQPPTDHHITHPNYKLKDYPKIMIDFKNIQSQQRANYVEGYVRQLANKAQEGYECFRKLMLELVQGYAFQINSFVDCDKSIIDANRKIMDVQMQKLSIEKAAKDIDELTLEDLYFLEKQTYKEQLKEIMAFIDGQIEFKPSKLLQAYCFFQHSDQINQCLESVRNICDKNNCLLWQITNKLNESEGLSEVLVRIIINNIPAQIHLVLALNYKEQFFNSIVVELTSNQAFSCFTRIKMVSDAILPQQLAQLKQFVNFHLKNKAVNNISSIKQRFKELESLLPFKLVDETKLQVNHSILSNGVQSLALIKQRKTNLKETVVTASLERLRRVIQFKRNMKDESSAHNQQNKFYKSFQQKELGQIQSIIANGEPLSKENEQLLIGYAQYLKKKGVSLMESNVLDKAERKFDQYIDIAKKLNSILMLAEGKRCIGVLQHKKGNYNQAILLFQKCLQTIKDSNKSTEQLPALINLAKVYMAQEKYQMALQTYGKCEELFGDSLQAHLQNVQVLCALGEIHELGQRLQTAKSYYQRCLQLQQKKSGLEGTQSVVYYIKLSNVLHEQGDGDSSIETLQKCIATIQMNEANKDKQIEVRRLLSARFIDSRQYQEGVQQLESSLKLVEATEGKSSLNYSECLKELGEVQQLLGHYQESLRLYEQSLAIKQKINSKDEITHLQVIAKIAKTYQILNSPTKSQHYQQKASNIQEKSKDKHSKDRLSTFNKIGKKSLEKGNYPISLKYFQKCIEILQQCKGKDCQESIPILHDMGSAYKLQGHHQQAIKYFSDCLTLVEKYKGKECLQAGQNYHELASIYEVTGDIELAETYYLAALHLCQKYNIKFYTYAHCNFGLANIYFEKKLFSKAFESYQKSLPILGKLKPQQYNKAIKQMDICDRQIEMQFGEKQGESES